MNRGFYTIMGAQFFSSLADNALIIVAIGLLTAMKAPASLTPLLKLWFVLPSCSLPLSAPSPTASPRAG
jgi:LPLT family lysophospholipid transporter-like MFS transporter